MAEHNVVFTTLDADCPWSLETYLAVRRVEGLGTKERTGPQADQSSRILHSSSVQERQGCSSISP